MLPLKSTGYTSSWSYFKGSIWPFAGLSLELYSVFRARFLNSMNAASAIRPMPDNV